MDESWEVLNLIVRRGLLRWTTSVKLPFSASSAWSEDGVSFDCTSRQAFAREVPPVAAPARPLSANTPLSLPAARLSCLLVDPASRRASAIIIQHGWASKWRVPVSDVTFEGKLLRVAAQAENLPPYLSDDEISARVRELLASDGVLTGEERRSVKADVLSGVVTLSGNVRTGQTKERIAGLAAWIEGATASSIEVVDDIELELAIGRALDQSGRARSVRVYARCTLGEVTLYGEATSAAAVEDLVRFVSRVPGVRSVVSRMAMIE